MATTLFLPLLFAVASCIIHLQSPTAHLYLPSGTPLGGVVVSSGLVSVTNTLITSTAGEGVRYVGKCGPFTNTVVFDNVEIGISSPVTSPTSAVLDVDLSCDSNSDVSITNVRVLATGACISSSCASAGVRVTQASSSTVTNLVVDSCDLGDASNGYGTPLTQDLPALGAGIEMNGPVSDSLAAWLTGDGSYDVSPPVFQQFPRNIRRRNPGLTGRPYDVLLSDTTYGSPSSCGDVCRLLCGDQCLADPTRFPVGVPDSGVCLFTTQFPDLAYVGAFCTDRALLFPTDYAPTIVTLNRTVDLRIEGWVTDLPLGPYASGNTLLGKPLIRHSNTQAPTIWETDPHSININSNSLEVVGVDFQIEDTYEFPFYGSVLFSTARTTPIQDISLRNCSFYSVEDVTFLFDVVPMLGLVSTMTIDDCLFDGVGGGLVPDGLDSLDFLHSTIRNDDQFGVMDVTVGLGGARIIGNTAESVGYFTTTTCSAIVCLSDTLGPSEISGNDFSGTLTGPASVNYVAMQLRNVAIDKADIVGNVDSGVMVGLDYANMPLIPCNETDMFVLKQSNPGFFGYFADILCDPGLPSELSCSGLCFPSTDPPTACEVSSLYNPSTFGWLFDRFATLGAAVSLCTATPVQRIYVRNAAPIFETVPIEFRLPNAGQTSMEVLRHPADTVGPNPVVYGEEHTFPENENLAVVFSEVDFAAVSPGSLSMFSGYVADFSFRGGTISAVPLATEPPFGSNAPYVDSLVSLLVDTDGIAITFEDTVMRGAQDTLLQIQDHPYEDPIPIVLRNVELSLVWGQGIVMGNLWNVYLDSIECVFWCGGLIAVDAVNSLTFLPDHASLPLYVWIDDFSTFVNASDPVQGAFPTTVPGGFGDRAGFWLENPASVPTAGVLLFHVRDVSSVGHPVAGRLVSMSEDVLELNEQPVPIVNDPLKPLREFARVNTMQGAVHDVKKGLPPADVPTLDSTHTCDDLCPPVVGPSCEVNAAFDALTPDWGTRRFADIATAIRDCTLADDPVPIQLVLVPGQTEVTHVEDVLFDSVTRGVHLKGTEPSFLVSLVGRHVVDTSQVGRVTVADMVLALDSTLTPRTTPVVEVIPGPSSLDSLSLERLTINTGLSSMPYTGSVLKTGSGFSGDVELRAVSTSPLVRGAASMPLFDVQTGGGDLAILSVLTARSDGAAVSAVAPTVVVIIDSAFSSCLAATGIPPPEACVYVDLGVGGTVTTSGSTVDRTGVAVSGALNPSTGRYLTGVWVQHAETVSSPTAPLSAALTELRGWETSGDVDVGLRIPGIAFTPGFLALGQADQKAYVRQISANNQDIGATAFYDVVLSADDDAIATSPKTLERLWCSDLCPGFITGNVLLYVLGGIIVLVGLVLLCLTVGPSIMNKPSATLSVARAAGKRRRKLRHARRRNEAALRKGQKSL